MAIILMRGECCREEFVHCWSVAFYSFREIVELLVFLGILVSLLFGHLLPHTCPSESILRFEDTAYNATSIPESPTATPSTVVVQVLRRRRSS